MTRAERFDDRVVDGLADLADPNFPDYFEDVLAITSRTRQRPKWTFPGRWLPMVDLVRRPAFAPALPWRALTLLAALLILAALAAAIVGSRPSLPPPFGLARNGLIAYDRGGDLFLGDPGGASRPLLVGPGDDNDPAFSRQGTMIAFLRLETPTRITLWVIRPDGSGLRELTPEGTDIGFWDWGPSDDTILYAAPEGGVLRLHSVSTDGSAAPRLVAADLSIDSFSLRPPLGREMLVRGVINGKAGLYVMGIGGEDRRPLLPPDATPLEDHDLSQPRYSPDGRMIAYQAWDEAFENLRLHVMNADGTNDRLLHWGRASFEGVPVWSPDSKQLVFQRAFPTSSEHLGFGHPFAIANVDGTGEPIEIGPSLGGDGAHAEFSPDGTKVLARTINSGTQMLIDPNTGAWTTVPWTSWSYPNFQRLPLN